MNMIPTTAITSPIAVPPNHTRLPRSLSTNVCTPLIGVPLNAPAACNACVSAPARNNSSATNTPAAANNATRAAGQGAVDWPPTVTRAAAKLRVGQEQQPVELRLRRRAAFGLGGLLRGRARLWLARLFGLPLRRRGRRGRCGRLAGRGQDGAWRRCVAGLSPAPFALGNRRLLAVVGL